MRNRIVGGADFDHMFDHLQNRTTREQEYTRARKSIFFVSKSAKKTQNNPKNVKTAIGVVEAASSSLVTQTISSVHNRFKLWTLDTFWLVFAFWLILSFLSSSSALFLLDRAREIFDRHALS